MCNMQVSRQGANYDKMDPGDAATRSYQEFLLVYNKMAEKCFNQCVYNMNYRTLTPDELNCVENCAGKCIRTNHKLMSAFMIEQQEVLNKRLEESAQQQKQAEMQQQTSAMPVVASEVS